MLSLSLPWQLLAENEQLFEIDGVVLTSAHTVLDPADGVFKHAEDVIAAKKLDHRIPVVRAGLQATEGPNLGVLCLLTPHTRHHPVSPNHNYPANLAIQPRCSPADRCTT